MGCMSASDAAPLPRLGEVFFDVRGESRSMRLSWYADTGVAVFSIWQGGTCTGTFRLPMTDLPRMVEALQRGPHGHDDPMTGEQAASRESRRPPARSPRQDPADGDIVTGQTTAAIYLPPVEADLAGYQAASGTGGDFTGDYPPEPAEDFSSEYPAVGTDDFTSHHPSGSAVDFTGGYDTGQAEPPGDYTGDYAAGQAEHTGDYAAGPAEHTGNFSRDHAEHTGDFTGEYAAGPAADAPGKRGSRHRGRRPDEDAGGYPGPAGPRQARIPAPRAAARGGCRRISGPAGPRLSHRGSTELPGRARYSQLSRRAGRRVPGRGGLSAGSPGPPGIPRLPR